MIRPQTSPMSAPEAIKAWYAVLETEGKTAAFNRILGYEVDRRVDLVDPITDLFQANPERILLTRVGTQHDWEIYKPTKADDGDYITGLANAAAGIGFGMDELSALDGSVLAVLHSLAENVDVETQPFNDALELTRDDLSNGQNQALVLPANLPKVVVPALIKDTASNPTAEAYISGLTSEQRAFFNRTLAYEVKRRAALGNFDALYYAGDIGDLDIGGDDSRIDFGRYLDGAGVDPGLISSAITDKDALSRKRLIELIERWKVTHEEDGRAFVQGFVDAP